MNSSICSDLFISMDSDDFSDALDVSQVAKPLGDLLDESFLSPRKNLNVCHINAQSIPGHYTDLLNTFNISSLHVCLVSESFLKPTLPSTSFSLPGFSLIRNDRIGKGGGGVAIYLRSEFKYKILNVSPQAYTASMEHIFIEVSINPTVKFFLGVVYAPPTVDYFNTLELLLETYVPQYDNILIMGDFNTCPLRDARAKRLLNITASFNLSLLELNTTFHVNDSHSWLDHIIASDADRISCHGQLPAPGFSNHDLIFASYKIRVPRSKPKVVLQRNLAGICREDLCNDISNINWSCLYNLSNINDKVEYFNNSITEVYDIHAPLHPVRLKRDPAPWLTDAIRQYMAKRDYLYRKNRKDPSVENTSLYKKARNRCNQMIRNAKKRYIFGKISTGTPNNMWKLLHSLGFGRSKASAGSSVDVNALNKHFATATQLVDGVVREKTVAELGNLSQHTFTSFTFSSVSNDEILKIITSITSKAVGQDGLGRDLFIPILNQLLPLIAHIINFSLSSGCFPSIWKKANVVPIPKKSVTSEPKDFRPISILPFLSKVLEKVVYRQLSHFLQSHSLLNPFQSGFRSAHSTSTTLIKITDDIRLAMDDKQLTLLTLLDFSNAFNCVDHSILLAILRSLNISLSVCDWFRSYLCGRKQRVQVDDTHSDWCDVVAGVPQGGVLSPLLFSIFINTLVTVLRFSSFHLYADDVQLYLAFPPSDIANAVELLTEDLRAVSSWSQKFGLKINTSKTQVMITGSRGFLSRLDRNSLPSVKYNDVPLVYCSDVKNLGLVISESLNWDNHITEASRKIFGSMHAMKRMQNFLPFSAKITLVNSILLPIIDYADVCYCDATEDQLNKLERLLNVCIRYVFGLRKYDHISAYRSQLKWLKIRFRRDTHILCLLYNILHNPMSPSYLKERFCPLSCSDRPSRSSQHLLLKTPVHKTSFYTDSFTVSAIRLWNSLPVEIREAASLGIFKSKLHHHFLSLQQISQPN